MTSSEFVRKALDVATSYKTVYGWGTFGWPWSQDDLDRVTKQYPGFYTAAKRRELQGYFGKGYFAFDCVGLIKGLLWGWSGNQGKAYGGAVYASNGVPDIDANVMISKCAGGGSTDFSSIIPGEVVWLQGHIGIYAGNGQVVECTPAWANGTQITALLNLGSISGLKSRKWTKHGKIPWVQYGSAAAPPPAKPAPVTPKPPAPAKPAGISVGSSVMITGDRFSTGETVPQWAKRTSHVVSQIANDRALLGASDGIRSWVELGDLRRV